MAIEAQRAAQHYGSNLPTSDYSRPGLGSVSPPSPDVGEGDGDEEQSSHQQPAAESNAGRDRTNRREQSENTGSDRQNSEPLPRAQQRPASEPRQAVINPGDEPPPENSEQTSPEPAPAVPESPEVPEAAPEQAQPQTTPAPEGEAETVPEVQGDKESEGPRGLSQEERQQARELRKVDRKVRNHEQAHVAAGGQYVKSRAKFEYTYGPDGKRYAVGGEVKLDTGKARTPEKTIKKMQQVRNAALAPSEPSSQDYSVARKAARKASKARMKLAKKRREGEGEETGEQAEGVDRNQPENQPPEQQSGENEAPSEPGQGGAEATGASGAPENSSAQPAFGRNQAANNRIDSGRINQAREQQAPAGRSAAAQRAGENTEQENSGIYNRTGAGRENSAPTFGGGGGQNSQNQAGGRLNLLA